MAPLTTRLERAVRLEPSIGLVAFATIATAFAVLPACSVNVDPAAPRVASVAEKVVFGTDDRHEAYSLPDLGLVDLYALRRSTALLVDTNAVRDDKFKLTCADPVTTTSCQDVCTKCDLQWGDDYATSQRECFPAFDTCPDLCADEPFRDQWMAGECSGFLVGPELLVTAGHCVANVACSSTAIVFGYEMQLVAGSPEAVTHGLDAYHCREVVAAQHGDPSTPDWALLRLDRPVLDRVPLCLERTKAPRVGDKLAMAGHPMGLPLKIDTGAEVVSVDSDGLYFEATTDSSTGSSGGAVLDATSLKVLGILTRGPEYGFEVAAAETCSRSRVCDPVTGCGGAFPGVLRTSAWQAFVPDTECYVPGPRCTDATMCAAGCACFEGSCAQGLQCGGAYCVTANCPQTECRVSGCDAATGCTNTAMPDCASTCGGGAERCVSGRCGDPRQDGFEEGMADYWVGTDGFAGPRPPWFVVDDQAASGKHSLRAAPAGSWTDRVVMRKIATRAGATVSFAYRISAAEGDTLVFAVDGVQRASFSGGSGTAWATFMYPATPADGYLDNGEHTLAWGLRRGADEPAGDSTAWIDDVAITHLPRACGCTQDSECQDGVACNGDEQCIEGRCVDGDSTCRSPLACDAQFDVCVACVRDADCHGHGLCEQRQCIRCAQDTDCDDEDLCNGAERCVGETCREGTPLRCDDGDACNGIEYCNPLTGCAVVPSPASSKSACQRPKLDAGPGERDAGDAGDLQADAGHPVWRTSGCGCELATAHGGTASTGLWLLLLVTARRRLRSTRSVLLGSCRSDPVLSGGRGHGHSWSPFSSRARGETVRSWPCTRSGF